jgi:hypothetical protein
MFSIPRLQPQATSGVAPGAFGGIPGISGAFGMAPGIPAQPAAPAGFMAVPGGFAPAPFPISGFNPTPPTFLTGAPGSAPGPFGPAPGGVFGQIASLGRQGHQAGPAPAVRQQPMQIFPGASVFSSPAGTSYQPSGQFAREAFYQAPIDPAYRSRSIEIEATGRGPAVHSSTACSSNFSGLAQRISYMLSGSPTDDNVRLALNTLENCLNERTRAAPASGMNQAHQMVFDLVDKLGRFIADYYTNAGAERGGMSIQYLGSVSAGFQVTLNRPVTYQGRQYTVFAVKSNTAYPVRGGKRKSTRRVKRKSRRAAGKSLRAARKSRKARQTRARK